MILKKVIYTSVVSVVLGVCSGFSMDHDSEVLVTTKKHYPVCVGTKILMNLASVLPHDEAGNDIHKTLLSFNQRVTDILIKRSADPSCGREALQHEAENILAILKRICTEKSFSGKSQVIATAIEPDLTELVTKIEALETYADVENLIEGYIPTIAAKEFLVRYKDVEEKNIHCEDCGRGYLKSCKGLKGKVSLECRLCNHHQESPFQIKVRLVY